MFVCDMRGDIVPPDSGAVRSTEQADEGDIAAWRGCCRLPCYAVREFDVILTCAALPIDCEILVVTVVNRRLRED